MKILLVITGLAMGGAEHVVVNLADALVARGHSVKIAYLTGEALVLPQSIDVEVVAIGMQGAKSFLPAYFKLRSLVKKFKPDVVHGHMFHANFITRLLRLSTSIPKVISTAHSNNEGGKLRMLAYRLTDKLADAFTNVSQDAVDTFVAKGAAPQGRMLSVVNGIDVEKFKFDAAARKIKKAELCFEQNIILAVGRLDIPKDYPNLLNAIKKLTEIRQDFKVFIVGDGPLKTELEWLVSQLNIGNFVEFMGIRRDVQQLLSAADIYVMSSAWEGLPMVILESAASERVVVATDCGGVSEVVASNGFLVEPKNSTLLAKALNNALSMSMDERAEMGALARQRIVDRFSLDMNVDAYLRLFFY